MTQESSFTPDWVLSESGDSSMIMYLKRTYGSGEQLRTRWKSWLVKTQRPAWGGSAWYVVSYIVTLILSVLRSKIRRGLFSLTLSWSQSDCLMLVFCETVYVHQENGWLCQAVFPPHCSQTVLVRTVPRQEAFSLSQEANQMFMRSWWFHLVTFQKYRWRQLNMQVRGLDEGSELQIYI